MIPLLTVSVAREEDVVAARQRARRVAELLCLDKQDQIRFATAVSELARNAYEYAGGGHTDFVLNDDTMPPRLVARFRDLGPGISDLETVLDGSYVSSTGMGLGIVGARRLSDAFRIQSVPGEGTTIEIEKVLPPRRSLTLADVRHVVDTLVRERPAPTLHEIQQQNREIVLALEEARQRREEVERLNAELAETNRGVLALYAELDDRAADIKRAAEVKSRFFSEVSHELRTPLTSIVSLSWILLNDTDGALSEEQHHQVALISKAAQSLRELVDDTLDLAKIEAGVFSSRRGEFTVGQLFAALRGMFRPILGNSQVTLTFDIAPGLPVLVSDEGRVSQVLRNFISNAIKFTPHGEIRVSASMEDEGTVRFAVRDSGIGIAPEHHSRIFLDFEQVDSHLQRHVRGTGLGLPLSRRIAALLGGRVELASAPEAGSTFALIIPTILPPEHIYERP